MPNRRDNQNHGILEQPHRNQRAGYVEGRKEERGRIVGPPKTATDDNASKQWQPPKKDTTPSNRPEKK